MEDTADKDEMGENSITLISQFKLGRVVAVEEIYVRSYIFAELP